LNVLLSGCGSFVDVFPVPSVALCSRVAARAPMAENFCRLVFSVGGLLCFVSVDSFVLVVGHCDQVIWFFGGLYSFICLVARFYWDGRVGRVFDKDCRAIPDFKLFRVCCRCFAMGVVIFGCWAVGKSFVIMRMFFVP